ncbi:DNA-binding transcriptional regulator, ArsR family [Fontibacillus panacisegetis]|uniref:DNA-binding transcriptional regulator, ArsR family n=1 Tax=Fontibacillus panacisegetis TaxID=670482 RepID=A0A1G7UPD1_9BACL|nr:winged helix-turn-helix domain-containing protein [Fontibacillus panacisegetis]SDG49455.1 DNA-binding transcriptional regulator, ArsR family [Fontibacillus panacisegetis]
MKKSIDIRISAPMEFLNSLFALGTDKGFIEMIRAFDLEPNAKITGMLQEMKKTLSHYIQQELTYFFDSSGLGFILYKYIVHNPTLDKVNEIIDQVQQDTADEFVFKIIESVCKNTLPERGTPAYKAFKGKQLKLLQLIQDTKFQDENRKSRVIEAVENPEEIKQRFTLLLNRLNTVAFTPFEDEIIKNIETEKPRYDAMLKDNPDLFISQYLNIDSLKDHPPGYVLHLSFFKYVSCHAYSSYQENVRDWFVLGIYSELLFNDSAIAERQAHFFKVLSDVNRIAIIRLLSERPWFGQELAEALNISPPTVSYHIGFLQQIGVVSFTRTENRFYYELDRDKLLRPLDDFLKSF